MRVIVLIEEPDIIERILKHLKRWHISYRPVYRSKADVISYLAIQAKSNVCVPPVADR